MPGIDEHIIGKYEVRTKTSYSRTLIYHTDNPREAIWVANKYPEVSVPINVRGERDFVKEMGRWKLIPLP